MLQKKTFTIPTDDSLGRVLDNIFSEWDPEIDQELDNARSDLRFEIEAFSHYLFYEIDPNLKNSHQSEINAYFGELKKKQDELYAEIAVKIEMMNSKRKT